METVYSDTAGTSFQGGGLDQTYDLLSIVPSIEVRAYGYRPPAGFLIDDTFIPTEEIGLISSDLSVSRYENFGMLTDVGITQTTIATVLAYAGLESLDTLYDRTMAEWYTNGSPFVTPDGTVFDTGTTDMILDGDAVSEFAYASGPDEITINPTLGVSITLVGSTEVISSGESDEITIAFPGGISDDDVAYIFVGHSQSTENVWNTPSGSFLSPMVCIGAGRTGL